MNLLAVNLASSMVSRYISIRPLKFFLSSNPCPFNSVISFLASLSCLISLLKVGFSGGVVMSMTSICFSTVSIFPFSFLLKGSFVMTYFSIVSFLDDDLVKGLLALILIAIASEGKSNLLPFFPVALADGIYANSGDGWGENSLCGE
jgi:hypothetical protein